MRPLPNWAQYPRSGTDDNSLHTAQTRERFQNCNPGVCTPSAPTPPALWPWSVISPVYSKPLHTSWPAAVAISSPTMTPAHHRCNQTWLRQQGGWLLWALVLLVIWSLVNFPTSISLIFLMCKKSVLIATSQEAYKNIKWLLHLSDDHFISYMNANH